MASFYPVDIEANVVAALIDVESEEVVKVLGTQTADVSYGEDNAVEIDGILSDDITPGVYSILATEVATGAYYTIDDVEVTVPLDSEDISGDAAAGSDTRWYDLTGSPVGHEPQTPGIYVKVSGGKAEKVMVK